MRYSSNHKAETRRRIIGEAARRFRKDGVEGTGLVPLMKALGLTHGGFYAHFPSKDALVEASLAASAEQTFERWPDPTDGGVDGGKDGDDADAQLRGFIADYLSPAHRDDPGAGCPLSSLAAELGLRGIPSSKTDAIVDRMDTRLRPCAIAAREPDRGLVALAAMVGALTLSRAVADPAHSARILEAVRAAIRPGE
jgi:TetR/AcrR family transcriptional repressor of nem operon